MSRQDEVVAVKDAESPKGRIVIKAEDLGSWLVEDLKWNWGLTASFHEKSSVKMMSSANGIPVSSLLSNTKLDLSEVEKEKGMVHIFNFIVSFYSKVLFNFIEKVQSRSKPFVVDHRIDS